LALFLLKHRGVRHSLQLPKLTVRKILVWADAHHRRTGEWPSRRSGTVKEAPGESWKGIATALALGRRGLPGGSSLPRLLARHRGVRNPRQLPHLTLRQIRAWAQAHRRRTGRWPSGASGPILEAPGETWSAVESALFSGYRGLPAGLTFARLFGLSNTRSRRTNQGKLSLKQILAWADAHHRRTGEWPNSRSGPIADAPSETWRTVDQALRTKQRGLRYGGTLIHLLAEQRGLHTRSYRPRLTERQILTWARQHYRRHGTWPNFRSGPIEDAPGETWRCIDHALRTGLRGLSRGRSLAQLLAQRWEVRNRTNFPRLSQKQILQWAEAYHRRNGTWPNTKSGAIHQAGGETWKGVDLALRVGYRGLRGGWSLARLLAHAYGIRNRTNLPALNPKQIVSWAEAHFQRTGSWPTRNSGAVSSAPEETWHGIEMALQHGCRGLPGKSSLSRLLLPYRRKAATSPRAIG
jgi:hypothetical protein